METVFSWIRLLKKKKNVNDCSDISRCATLFLRIEPQNNFAVGTLKVLNLVLRVHFFENELSTFRKLRDSNLLFKQPKSIYFNDIVTWLFSIYHDQHNLLMRLASIINRIR